MTRIREVDEVIKPITDILKAKREEFVEVVKGAILDNIYGETEQQAIYETGEIDYKSIANDIIKYMETQKIARNR